MDEKIQLSNVNFKRFLLYEDRYNQIVFGKIFKRLNFVTSNTFIEPNVLQGNYFFSSNGTIMYETKASHIVQ